MLARSSERILKQLLMKFSAASESTRLFPSWLARQTCSSPIDCEKQAVCSCIRLSIICSSEELSNFLKLQGCRGERVRPVEVSIRMARQPSAQASFFSDREKPLESRNSGAKQCSSLLVSSSSLEGTKEVDRTALMKSSPFLLYRMVLTVSRLWPLRWKCICCSPNATCFRYLLPSDSSNGPNSSSRFFREQFLYSSEMTQRLALRVTSAQMGRMLGCQKLTFSFFSSGIRLTKRFSPFQYPIVQFSSCSAFELSSSLRISSWTGILFSSTNSTPADRGRVRRWSEGGAWRQFLLTFLMATVSGLMSKSWESTTLF